MYKLEIDGIDYYLDKAVFNLMLKISEERDYYLNFLRRLGHLIEDEIIFTHLWVVDFGWENTIFVKEDFIEVELLTENDKDGKIFSATQENGKTRILKGYKK